VFVKINGLNRMLQLFRTDEKKCSDIPEFVFTSNNFISFLYNWGLYVFLEYICVDIEEQKISFTWSCLY